MQLWMRNILLSRRKEKIKRPNAGDHFKFTSMIYQIFQSFFKKNFVDLAQIKELPSLRHVDELIEQYSNAVQENELGLDIDSYSGIDGNESSTRPLQYLEALFDSIVPLLQASLADSRLSNQWRLILRELLVKVPFTGDSVSVARKIKEDLDRKHDLNECTVRVKNLLIEHTSKVHENQLEVQEFLADISNKLQAIYSEINEAKQSCSNSSQSKANVRDSFSRGMEELKTSLDSSGDIDLLKSRLNQLVDALQHKVEKELEQDESGTQILENTIAGLSNKVKSLENHTQDLEKAIREKHQQAITDPLTGLYNRAAYIQELEKAWMQWQEEGVQATLLVWDIDHFKMLNDRYGHAAGDKVLQSVANKLKSSIHNEDIVARFGGEEFVMLLHNQSIQSGKQLAESVRSMIASTEFTYKQQSLQVTISCGVASFTKNDTPTTLFERADKALYKAKRTGRNKVEALADAA